MYNCNFDWYPKQSQCIRADNTCMQADLLKDIETLLLL